MFVYKETIAEGDNGEIWSSKGMFEYSGRCAVSLLNAIWLWIGFEVMGSGFIEKSAANAYSHFGEGDERVVFTFSGKTNCWVESAKDARWRYWKGK